MSLEKLAENKCFGGRQLRYRHDSKANQCSMTFSIYLPPQATEQNVPVLYWLSGLTCSDENFVIKSGAQQYAAKFGIAIVCPDTSPRGDDVPDDENGDYDFGLGAGFYLNATEKPWDKNYHMSDYVISELPDIINKNFAVDGNRCSISGHSMGGHGALTLAFKNSHHFKSVSAFSPICSAMECPWGQKALANYLGNEKQSWLEYDATELLKTATQQLPILIDQGSADDFLSEQLKPELFKKTSDEVSYPIRLRMQNGYDHSYFFISSFIGEHIEFHAEHLYDHRNRTAPS